MNPTLILTGDLITEDKKSISCTEARKYSFNCGRDGNYFDQLWGDRK